MTHEVFNRLRDAYTTGVTKPLAWRRGQLNALRRMITENKQAIIDAVAADLGKPASETLLMEIDLVLSEANFVRRRMRWWSARHPKPMHWLLQPAVGWTINEPKGVVLIISPWNYPVLLSLEPMVDAIAAGNAVCLKPSELSPHISHLTAELIERYMDTSAIAVVEGGPEETTDLLAEPFDHIFYTGGGRVGRIVMKAASEQPDPGHAGAGRQIACFVDGTVPLAATARRIAWGKFTNAGQTCVAPDYVLATPDVAQVLPNASRWPSPSSTARIRRPRTALPALSTSAISTGCPGCCRRRATRTTPPARSSAAGRPTVSTGTSRRPCCSAPRRDAPVIGEEIFGPILPVIVVQDAREAIEFINARSRPLAAYVFLAQSEDARASSSAT